MKTFQNTEVQTSTTLQGYGCRQISREMFGLLWCPIALSFKWNQLNLGSCVLIENCAFQFADRGPMVAGMFEPQHYEALTNARA